MFNTQGKAIMPGSDRLLQECIMIFSNPFTKSELIYEQPDLLITEMMLPMFVNPKGDWTANIAYIAVFMDKKYIAVGGMISGHLFDQNDQKKREYKKILLEAIQTQWHRLKGGKAD